MTVKDIIAQFGSARAVGDALGGVPRETVKKWSQRNSIPAEHDLALVAAARDRGLPITLETLAEMRAPSTPTGAAA